VSKVATVVAVTPMIGDELGAGGGTAIGVVDAGALPPPPPAQAAINKGSDSATPSRAAKELDLPTSPARARLVTGPKSVPSQSGHTPLLGSTWMTGLKDFEFGIAAEQLTLSLKYFVNKYSYLKYLIERSILCKLQNQTR
jgi:hypothetical protein